MAFFLNFQLNDYLKESGVINDTKMALPKEEVNKRL